MYTVAEMDENHRQDLKTIEALCLEQEQQRGRYLKLERLLPAITDLSNKLADLRMELLDNRGQQLEMWRRGISEELSDLEKREAVLIYEIEETRSQYGDAMSEWRTSIDKGGLKN